ncbi:DUF4349 domain-containing protein [Nonomuraea sp. NPDC048882]|uniref:DUF4349 domain-containing protein n=1 Tax=unclassified Nonomuraea TaxID=2593643 RepID=UPI003410E704
MRRIRYGIALSAACAALALSGCGGGGGLVQSDSGSQAAGAPSREYAAQRAPQDAAAQDGDVREQAARPQAGRAGVAADVKVTRQDRQVIYTGNMTVRAKQVSTAAQQAKQIVTAAGGYLSQEQTSSASDTEDSATLEFKIPPAKYAEVVGRFGKELGKQLSMRQGTEDVTLKVADVESRLKSAQESLESLRTLLKKADTIGQVLQVEREISTREADLESLQAQQKELAAQVSMATLSLQLVGPAAEVVDPVEEPAGFLGGLKSGWNALVSFTKIALTVIGALLPWLLFASPLIALVVWRVRRDRARRPAPPSGPAPAQHAGRPTEPGPSEPSPEEPGPGKEAVEA